MTKEFVTYEQALALKELGFNESCFGCYQLSELRDYKKGLEISWIMTLNTLNGYRIYDDETQTSAPLKQQVFRWFREKHGLQAYLTTFLEMCGNNDDTYHVVVDGSWYPQQDSKDYEKTENACIDKLIELAKG